MACADHQRLSALEAQLCEQFTEPEFRRFFRTVAPTLAAELLGEASLARLVGEALDVLARHGRIDREFFVAWGHARPGHRSTIAAIALRFGVELPDPSAGTSNSGPASGRSFALSEQDIMRVACALMFFGILYRERDSDNPALVWLGALLLCVVLPSPLIRGRVEFSVTLIAGAGMVGAGKYLDARRTKTPLGDT